MTTDDDIITDISRAKKVLDGHLPPMTEAQKAVAWAERCAQVGSDRAYAKRVLRQGGERRGRAALARWTASFNDIKTWGPK